MHASRIFLLLLCAALWSAPDVRAQEPAEAAADEVEVPVDAPSAAGDDAETTAADAESYLDIEEDDFRPSEEIPADQSIDFPTDI